MSFFRFVFQANTFFIVLLTCAVLSMGAGIVQAQVATDSEQAVENDQKTCYSDPDSRRNSVLAMGTVETILLVIVLLVLPLKGKKPKEENLRGLGLPNGSIRGMLALVILGSMINFLLFGSCLLDKERFDSVLDAFITLSVAVMAFYFANRASIKP